MTRAKVRWLFHATATVHDYDAALDWLGRFCGCVALDYSVQREDPLLGRRGGVTWIADTGLELMQPVVADSGPARFLRRVGPGLSGVGVQVSNLAEAVALFEREGIRVVGDPTGEGWCLTHPADTYGVSYEWAERDFAFDPRVGRETPPRATPPLVDVRRVAYVGSLVTDAAGATDQLASLWDAPLLFVDPDASVTVPYAAFSLRDAVYQLYQLPEEGELAALWGVLPHHARAHVLALRVGDLDAAAAVLAAHDVRVTRRDESRREFLTDPRDTHGILLGWTDRDVEGDPRGPVGQRAT